ncbi:MAG TPA: GGDEF domain-containing protein [Devosia sp.]|jgi:diguanylate cyclase (GGDEF)-like protein|uniref:GGDEF domain-containing protein n=1 Tax=Devosia sp. TaxID=1871048 RepID=UPI002DDD42EC|nr:GGDEF domain-containing protein [Devosia sp.]HEV2517632.1 GGDEF domain-containing protein [Devosia sp.]
MFANLTAKSEQKPLPVRVRSRILSLATVTLVVTLVVTAIAGFAHVSSQQRAMAELRAQADQLRTMYQSVADADANAMHFLGGETAALRAYQAEVERLTGADAAIFDAVGAIAAPSSVEPQRLREVVAGLLTNWNEAIDLAASGNRQAGLDLMASRRTGEAVTAIKAGVGRVLDSTDQRMRAHDGRIQAGTTLVLLMQLGAGLLAILGLVYAFRSSVTEADGRAAAVETADRARQQVARLFEMADVLQSASDHADANAVLKATALELVPGFSGALYVFNNSRDRLVLSTTWARAENDALPETINPNACWALKRGKPHLNRGDASKLCCAHHVGGEASLEIPMIARGEIVGLLQLFAAGISAEERLEHVTALGSALADGMSLALANMALREKLRNQALRDPLTGLYNRRYMEDCLQRFVRLADRENREISLIMVDLDHFKRLNDEHGHSFGDQVLRDTALTLTGSLRETDIVCRFGGEELVVILPDCPLERAADKAELLRLRIEELSNTHGTDISASFGVASVPHTSQSVTDLLQAADQALYKAKQSGRNQVAKAALRPYRPDRMSDEVAALEEFPRAAAE